MGSKPAIGQQQINASANSSVSVTNTNQIALAYLNQNYPELFLNHADVQIVYTKATPYAIYLTYQQYFNHFPIEDALLKIVIDRRGIIRSVQGNTYTTKTWPAVSLKAQPNFLLPQLPDNKSFPLDLQPQIKIRIVNNQPMYVYTYDYQFSTDRSRYSVTLDENGFVLELNNHRSYLSGVDTTVSAKVFLPDPLTTAGVEYGGAYMDNNDNDNAELNAEAAIVSMRVKLEDGVFYLKNDSVIIKDLNSPTVPVVTATIPQFYFTRSENGFEDVNAFYHITNMNNQILALGYVDMQNFYIEIDPHGASGADQSFYVSAIIPSIQYGEGGVDDAEDADVICHEYGHALSDHAAPGSNTGIERRAIDEGYGDYFAASYSRGYSDYNWEKIFSWDGHNEFWFGRNADSDKHYPEDNSDNYYSSSEIWSGALMDIFDLIGKDNTDKLVLEALHGSLPNMTMPQAAQLLLLAEELIFGGTFHDAIYNALDARGLINPVAINENVVVNGIQFLNTAGFISNGENIQIEFQQAIDFTINCYALDGKLLQTTSGFGNQTAWNFETAYSGIIILEVVTPEITQSIRLVRLDN